MNREQSIRDLDVYFVLENKDKIVCTEIVDIEGRISSASTQYVFGLDEVDPKRKRSEDSPKRKEVVIGLGPKNLPKVGAAMQAHLHQ